MPAHLADFLVRNSGVERLAFSVIEGLTVVLGSGAEAGAAEAVAVAVAVVGVRDA
jgi:hypothetical protein